MADISVVGGVGPWTAVEAHTEAGHRGDDAEAIPRDFGRPAVAGRCAPAGRYRSEAGRGHGKQSSGQVDPSRITSPAVTVRAPAGRPGHRDYSRPPFPTTDEWWRCGVQQRGRVLGGGLVCPPGGLRLLESTRPSCPVTAETRTGDGTLRPRSTRRHQLIAGGTWRGAWLRVPAVSCSATRT